MRGWSAPYSCSQWARVCSNSGIAAAYRETGRVEEAIPLFEQTLAACERLFGADHARTLRSQHSLASAYQAAGRADDAVKLFEQTLEARERVLGAGHKDTASTRKRLAQAREAAAGDPPD